MFNVKSINQRYSEISTNLVDINCFQTSLNSANDIYIFFSENIADAKKNGSINNSKFYADVNMTLNLWLFLKASATNYAMMLRVPTMLIIRIVHLWNWMDSDGKQYSHANRYCKPKAVKYLIKRFMKFNIQMMPTMTH